MLRTLRKMLARWIAPKDEIEADTVVRSDIPQTISRHDHSTPIRSVSVYDDTIYERARTQWQFGDWPTLVTVQREAIEQHPERARLAAMIAAAHLQTSSMTTARQFIRLAQDWGCSKQLLSRLLISGVHNSLGRAAAAACDEVRSTHHFEQSVAIGTPGSEARLISQARASEQLVQLALRPAEGGSVRLPSTGVATRRVPAAYDDTAKAVQAIKKEIKAELDSEFQPRHSNPYVHNRTMTPELNVGVRDFAERILKKSDLKPTYIDYLASKAIQIESSCVGRLATTVQDAVVRQLVVECIAGERIGILEIGALYGISLAILYNHAVTRFPHTQVICLDPLAGYYGKAVDAVLNCEVDDLTFLRNMKLGNVPEDGFVLLKHYSNDPAAIKECETLFFNLLVIDGDHSYEGVKFDFETYFPLLRPGGYVIFDDYNAKEWPGVQKFVDEDVLRATDFEYLGFFSRTAVGRKRKV